MYGRPDRGWLYRVRCIGPAAAPTGYGACRDPYPLEPPL